jgi:hypothetical protein
MKKFLQITAIMLSALTVSNFAQAQSEDVLERDVTLSVKLKPIQILTVDGSQVNLSYASKYDYDNGVTVPKDGHLSVYSIGAFNVTVQSSDSKLFNNENGVSADIDSEGITIKAKPDSKNELTYSLVDQEVNLGVGGKTIITSNEGGVDQKFNVSYKGKGGNAYVGKFFSENGSESIYTTTVTYTISAN